MPDTGIVMSSKVEEQKWERKGVRLTKKLKTPVAWVAGTTIGAFLMMFLAGCFTAVAAPGGWPAANVGLMAGGVAAMGVFFVGVIATIAYVADGI